MAIFAFKSDIVQHLQQHYCFEMSSETQKTLDHVIMVIREVMKMGDEFAEHTKIKM